MSAPSAARWSVHVERDRCCGSGQCVLAAPEVFDQAEDGLVCLLRERPPADSLERVRTAAYDCPSRAIALRAP
ncbi:MAG TPA: ferredoxin [Actinospica sp.]|nr:ferredoxin [Actinospica sp.]